MKYVKILALALGALSLTACSDSDSGNTATGVTVEMQQSEITVSENKGIFNVPIKVTGDANGPIKVKVKVEGNGPNPAQPFEERNGVWSGDYVVTSTDLNIPADTKTVNVEINTIDNVDENEAKTFTVTIESVEGATIGSQSSTNVTIKDNDSVPYEKVQGAYKFSFLDYDGVPTNWNLVISGIDEGEPGYGEELYINGFLGMASTSLTLYFHNNEATGETFIEFNLPEPMIWYDSANYVWAIKGMSLADGVIRGTFSEDLQTITFNEEDMIVYYVASPDFSSKLGIYDSSTAMSMTRQ